MDIGQPKRIIEIAPVAEPVPGEPDLSPDMLPEPDRAPVPAPTAPGEVEPAEQRLA